MKENEQLHASHSSENRHDSDDSNDWDDTDLEDSDDSSRLPGLDPLTPHVFEDDALQFPRLPAEGVLVQEQTISEMVLLLVAST